MQSADVHESKPPGAGGPIDTSVSMAADAAAGLLITVEQVALLWFGEVGPHGSASSNCQKVRRLIPHVLPARRIGKRWYVPRSIAEAWANGEELAPVVGSSEARGDV